MSPMKMKVPTLQISVVMMHMASFGGSLRRASKNAVPREILRGGGGADQLRGDELRGEREVVDCGAA